MAKKDSKENPIMSNEEAMVVIAEFNKWRRGIGKYRWHVNPERNVELPYSPSSLGQALDQAVSVLKRVVAGSRKQKGK